MALKETPKYLLPKDYRPCNGIPYKVRDGDDWKRIAHRRGINVTKLIYFNFKTTNSREVNFYLERNVGCYKETQDGINFMFSSSASPGIIYLPAKDTIIYITDALTTLSYREFQQTSPFGLNPIVRNSISGSAEYALWNFWIAKLRPVSEPRNSSHYYVNMDVGHLLI
jgi:hypothetical protein